MKPIAIFFHCVFFKRDGGAFQRSGPYIERYMYDLKESGLLDASSYFLAGINGGSESEVYAKLYLPRAKHQFHGLQDNSTNGSAEAMRIFAVDHPGWNIFFFHAKGTAHDTPAYEAAHYTQFENGWIKAMVHYLIYGWKDCVSALEDHDSAGCHWMANVGIPPVDHIWPGTFYWVTSDFAATLPPIAECPNAKQFGLNSPQARATSEQYIGLGPRLPKVKDFLPGGGEGVP